MSKQSDTRRFAVIGTPISHSLSVVLHSAVFKALGLPWQTTPLDPGDLDGLAALIEEIRSGKDGYRGANITIPYKKEVVAYCDELLPPAQRCGAVNTILRLDDHRLIGSNSDAEGFLKALKSELYVDVERLSSAVIFGTGGAAHAVAGALVGAGVAEIIVLSRTGHRAESFIAELQKRQSGEAKTVWRGAAYQDAFNVMDQDKVFGVVVNATPLGMVDDSMRELPQGWAPWLKRHARAIFDVVYRRHEPTLLVQWARENGIPATDGLVMLTEQAIISLKLWGVPAEPDEMRAIMRQALFDEGITRCAQKPTP